MQKQDLDHKVQQQLIEEFKTNPQVFEKVYEFYYEMILRYLAKRTMSSETAYDLTAETFIKAFENFNRFKWMGVSIKMWLYRIAINELKNFRKKPICSVLSEEIEGYASLKQYAKSELKELDTALFGDDELTKLSDAIATLKPEYQNVVSLYYFDGMQQNEIAQTINSSVSAVKSIMHRAIKHLRQVLSPNFALEYEEQ